MAKSKHKHNYVDCIFQYDGTNYTLTNGFIPTTREILGTYCDICGKIGDKKFVFSNPSVFQYPPLTEEEKKQLNPETRTIPTYYIGDWIKAKYILEKIN